MANRDDIHDRVLNASTKEELASAYGEWAEQYDEDLIDEMDYVAPSIAVQLFEKYLADRNARILDAGCGTGLVGAGLHQKGYHNMEGFDYSVQMLEKAREKGVYKQLHQGDLTARLNLPEDSYDGIISVGAFTCSHIGPEAFDELIGITRPGGYLCFTVRDRAWEEDNYRSAIDQKVESGVWTCLEETTTDYIRQEGSSCIICVYQKM